MNHAGIRHSERLLTIGQLTALTGVRKSTIRHWEREFNDFLQSVRTDGNQRRFPAEAVDKVEKIKVLVEEQGLTLRGVRQKLEQNHRTSEAQAPQPDTKSDVSLQKLADLMSEHVIRRLFYEK